MSDSKFFLKSRGVWGGIVPVVLGTLALLGYQVGPGMEQEAVGLGNSAIDTLTQSADSIVLVVAGFLALWSRLRTERKPLTATPKTT